MDTQVAPEGPTAAAVFFYGSYMNSEVLRGIGVTVRGREAATLADFDIEIRPLANVVPAAGHEVWGVLTSATHAELEQIYAHARDVLGRLYLPHAVLVQTTGGDLRSALCYIGGPAEPRPATDDYVDRVVAGARELEMPEAYVERLERFRPAR